MGDPYLVERLGSFFGLELRAYEKPPVYMGGYLERISPPSIARSCRVYEQKIPHSQHVPKALAESRHSRSCRKAIRL
jgi:hypothetical protein